MLEKQRPHILNTQSLLENCVNLYKNHLYAQFSKYLNPCFLLTSPLFELLNLLKEIVELLRTSEKEIITVNFHHFPYHFSEQKDIYLFLNSNPSESRLSTQSRCPSFHACPSPHFSRRAMRSLTALSISKNSASNSALGFGAWYL